MGSFEDNVMSLDYLKIAVTVTLAVIGWIVAHFFTVRRDLESKRRELSTAHLIDAYRILTNEVSHRDLNHDRSEKLENILSDIQLFGSVEQVQLARRLAEDVAAGHMFELDPLINSLRDDLQANWASRKSKETSNGYASPQTRPMLAILGGTITGSNNGKFPINPASGTGNH
jgi:hypothetical protein